MALGNKWPLGATHLVAFIAQSHCLFLGSHQLFYNNYLTQLQLLGRDIGNNYLTDWKRFGTFPIAYPFHPYPQPSLRFMKTISKTKITFIIYLRSMLKCELPKIFILAGFEKSE